MKRLSITVGLCLATVLVLSAMAASSASAKSLDYLCVAGAPERIELCVVGKGPITSPPTKKDPFKGSGGAVELAAPLGKIKCNHSESIGEIEGSNLVVKTVITYTGCIDSLSKECKTGAEKEVIKTNTLSGELVDLEKGEKRVGALLRPATGTEVTPEVKCSVNVKITGEVIGEYTPENSYSETGTLIFKVIGSGQQWRQIEEAGAFHELSAFGGKATLASTETLTYNQPVGWMA